MGKPFQTMACRLAASEERREEAGKGKSIRGPGVSGEKNSSVGDVWRFKYYQREKEVGTKIAKYSKSEKFKKGNQQRWCVRRHPNSKQTKVPSMDRS